MVRGGGGGLPASFRLCDQVVTHGYVTKFLALRTVTNLLASPCQQSERRRLVVPLTLSKGEHRGFPQPLALKVLFRFLGASPPAAAPGLAVLAAGVGGTFFFFLGFLSLSVSILPNIFNPFN